MTLEDLEVEDTKFVRHPTTKTQKNRTTPFPLRLRAPCRRVCTPLPGARIAGAARGERRGDGQVRARARGAGRERACARARGCGFGFGLRVQATLRRRRRVGGAGEPGAGVSVARAGGDRWETTRMHYICRKEGPAALIRWARTAPYKVQRAQGPGLPPLCEVPPPCPRVAQASLCCVGVFCCFRGGWR
jgi:hypothetical protein